MKNLVYGIAVSLIVISAALASEYDYIATRDGNEFTQANITATSATGLTITTSEGVAQIPYEQLPQFLQNKFRSKIFKLRQEAKGKQAGRLDKKFKDSPILDVINFYSEKAGCTPIIASNVAGSFSFEPPNIKGGGYFLDTLRKELEEHAGIIITPIDGQRISITYNDALK